MTNTQVWLTEHSYALLRKELQDLLRQREQSETATTEDADEHFLSQRDRDQRIRRIQEILLNATVGREPADDGVAEPGMLVSVRYGDDPEVETLLLAHREEGHGSGVEVCSPDSPLGRALCGAREGERRQYQLPNGEMMTVSLVRAVPYRNTVDG